MILRSWGKVEFVWARSDDVGNAQAQPFLKWVEVIQCRFISGYQDRTNHIVNPSWQGLD